MRVMEAAMAASERQFARSSVRVWIGINIDTISQKCLDKPLRLAIGACVSIASHDAVRRLQVVDKQRCGKKSITVIINQHYSVK